MYSADVKRESPKRPPEPQPLGPQPAPTWLADTSAARTRLAKTARLIRKPPLGFLVVRGTVEASLISPTGPAK